MHFKFLLKDNKLSKNQVNHSITQYIYTLYIFFQRWCLVWLCVYHCTRDQKYNAQNHTAYNYTSNVCQKLPCIQPKYIAMYCRLTYFRTGVSDFLCKDLINNSYSISNLENTHQRTYWSSINEGKDFSVI